MNSHEILARIPATNSGTVTNPNLYAIGVSKHGALHFHVEIEGDLYITTLRVKDNTKTQNYEYLRCIQKRCNSTTEIKFPDDFKGPHHDPASYFDYFKNNNSYSNLRDFTLVTYYKSKVIHTCDPEKIYARNINEYDLYPRPVGNDNTIAGTLTVPNVKKYNKRMKWDYHDAKKVVIDEKTTRSLTTDYVELTAYQVTSKSYLPNNLRDRIHLNEVPNTVPKYKQSQQLEYRDPITGTIFQINEPINTQTAIDFEVKQEDSEYHIDDDTVLTILVNELIDKETTNEEPKVVDEREHKLPASKENKPIDVTRTESIFQLTKHSRHCAKVTGRTTRKDENLLREKAPNCPEIIVID